jgi:hypothetical protein
MTDNNNNIDYDNLVCPFNIFDNKYAWVNETVQEINFNKSKFYLHFSTSSKHIGL